MSDPIIPDATVKAAKRGFIRTASQSVATALAGGITVNTVLAVIDGGTINPTVLIVTAAVAIATPIANGLQSYFSILASGIPDDYRPPLAEVIQIADASPSDNYPAAKVLARQQNADLQAALARAGKGPTDIL